MAQIVQYIGAGNSIAPGDSVTLNQNVTAGNTIVFLGPSYQGGGAGPTDSQGNTYTQVITNKEYIFSGSTWKTLVWVTKIPTSGPLTVTANVFYNFYGCAILEVEGLADGNPLDTYHAQSNSAEPNTTGTITTTGAGELLVAWFQDAGQPDSPASNPSAGWTIRQEDQAWEGGGGSILYQDNAPVGTYECTASPPFNSTGWIFAFKNAAIAPTDQTITATGIASASAVGTASVTLGSSSTTQYYRAVIIDHTKVTADQTDFPVLVSFTDPTLKSTANGGHVLNNNGADIAVYADSALSSLLDFEIDTYGPTTGALNVWVKVPALSSTADTTLYLAYGDGSTSLANAPGTWSNGYYAVYHLNDSTTTVTDSLGNYTATANNAPFVVSEVEGAKIGNAAAAGTSSGPISFSFGYNGVQVPANLSASTSSFWVFRGTDGDNFTASGGPDLVNVSYSTVDKSLNFTQSNSGSIDICTYTVPSGNSIPRAEWHRITAVVDETSSTGTLYLDGAQVATGTTSDTDTENTGPGFTLNGNALSITVAMCDELQYSSVARSAPWIATEYANQNSPSTFHSIGAENIVGSSTHNYTQIYSDAYSPSDSIRRSTVRSRADLISSADTIAKTASRRLEESFSVSDALLYTLARILLFLDVLTIADSVSKSAGRLYRDTVSLGDTIARKATRVLSSAFPLLDSLQPSKVALRVYQDSISLLDSVSKSRTLRRIYADTLSLLDSMTAVRALRRALSDTISLASSIGKGIARSIRDSLSLSDSIRTLTGRILSLADSLNPIDRFAKVASLHRAYSDAISLADSLLKRPVKVCQDTISLLDRVFRSIAKALVSTVSLIDSFSMIKVLILAFSDAISLADSITKAYRSLVAAVRKFVAELWTRLWPAETVLRTYTAEAEEEMIYTHKDPDSVEDFEVDWATVVGQDKITGSTWTVPDGMTLVDSSNTATSAIARLSEGVLGKRYQVENEVTLTSGQVKVQRLLITITPSPDC